MLVSMNPCQSSAAAILFAAQQVQNNQNNNGGMSNFQGPASTTAGVMFQPQQHQQQMQQASDAQQQHQQGNLNFANELKLLQQLQLDVGNGTNSLLMQGSNRSNDGQAAAFLQSVLDQKVRNPRFEAPLSQSLMGIGGMNPNLLQGSYLNDARLLMAQPNQFNAQVMMSGQLPLQQVNPFQQQALQLPEMPLPSPHSLFHRDGTKRMRGGVIEPFPEKLHRLLMEVEAAGRSDVISFVASGRAFAIHKPDKFFKEIVPLYFRQSRLSSFKRQLNLYGFELINTGPARGGYYHEMFVKDHPELCRRMRRVAVKVASSGKHEDEDDLQKDSKVGSMHKEIGAEGQHA